MRWKEGRRLTPTRPRIDYAVTRSTSHNLTYGLGEMKLDKNYFSSSRAIEAHSIYPRTTFCLVKG